MGLITTFYFFLYLYKYYLFIMFVIFQVIRYSYECRYCYLFLSYHNLIQSHYFPLSLSSTPILIIIPTDHINFGWIKNLKVNFLRICNFVRPQTIIIRYLILFHDFFVRIWLGFDASLWINQYCPNSPSKNSRAKQF